VKGFSLVTPFNVSLSLMLDGKMGGKPVAGSAACKARVSLTGGGEAALESLDLGANGTVLRVAGNVKNFSDPKADVTLTIVSFNSASVAPFAALPAFLKDAAATGKLTVKGDLKEARLKGDVDASASGMRAAVKLDAEVKAPFGDPTFHAQDCTAKLTLRPGPPLPADLGAKGPLSLTFSAKGKMNDFTVSLDVEGRDLELSYANYFKKLPGTDLTLKTSAVVKDMKDVRLDSLKAVLGPLVANVSGTIADATGAGRVDLVIKAPPFALGPLGEMSPIMKDYKASGKAGLDATAKGSFGAPQAQGTVDLLDVGAQPMEGVSLSGINGKTAFSNNGADSRGTVRIGSVTHPHYDGHDFRLDWTLKNAAADMSRADGAATFSASDGQVTNLPLAAKINALLKRNATNITYKSMSAHFKITQGVLATSDFTVASPQADILVKGTVRLNDMMADLRASFKLPPGALGGSLGQYLQDENGRPTIEVTIKGPLTGKPDVKPVVGKAATNAAKGLLQKYIGTPGANSGSNSSGGQQQNSPSPTQQLQKALGKGLGDLFKKKGSGQ
jgi:hypothetical protein